MEEIKDHLHLDVMTVTGKTLGENLAELRENGFYEKCSGWLAKFNERYGTSITKEDIITEDFPISSIEYALMIGYPLSFQSDNFVTPLIRSGVIATPLKSKFNGLERFLVDMECFSGSSGSPIFINRDSQYYLVGIEQSSYSYKEKEVGLGECENYNVLSSFLP